MRLCQVCFWKLAKENIFMKNYSNVMFYKMASQFDKKKFKKPKIITIVLGSAIENST